jgi:hypothetical protein
MKNTREDRSELAKKAQFLASYGAAVQDEKCKVQNERIKERFSPMNIEYRTRNNEYRVSKIRNPNIGTK